MKVFVSGLLAYDRIMDFPGRFSDHILPHKVHQLNVSFVTDELSEHFGGTAGNIAYSLALLGEQPVILAAAGKDFGPYKKHLETHNIDTRFIREVGDKPTSVATMMTDEADNQIASVYLGTMAYSGFSLFKREYPATRGGRDFAIIAPGNVEDMQKLPEFYRQNNIPFIFDPGQEIPLLSGEDLKNGMLGAKALISNDYELSLILEKTGLTEKNIVEHAEILVTTLGEQGSRVHTKEKRYIIPPAKLTAVVDPTGAGDAYRAGFIKGLVSGWPVEVCGKFGSTVAAYAIEKYGPQSHQFTFTKAAERYRQNFGDTLK